MIKNKYKDLIEQTFYFPRHGFEVNHHELSFHGIPLMEVVKEYGTPLKISYLPKITSQIELARNLFEKAIQKYQYPGKYVYCYCTKSSHFSFNLHKILESKVELETSSAFDLDIIQKLTLEKKLNKKGTIICNGYKNVQYIQKMVEMVKSGYKNLICVLDNPDEIDLLEEYCDVPMKIGIRVATEEEPGFSVYTSRMGMSYKKVGRFYHNRIKDHPNFTLVMMHFFVNSGIKDTSFYWSELARLVNVYCELKEECDDLQYFDIGGGMPIYNSLGVEHQYEYMIDQIVFVIDQICRERGVPHPDIYTEFGSFTVGESGAALYSIIGQKQQNDKENWYMIDSSFITTLPDTWGIGQKFILLAINHWNREYQRINLGGLTCDAQDFYNSDTHTNQVFLPKLSTGEPLFMGFFHTGAYQESLGGYGGIQHCLIPAPKHLVIDRNANGELTYQLFSPEQSPQEMLKILGY